MQNASDTCVDFGKMTEYDWRRIGKAILVKYVLKETAAEEKIEKLAQRYSGHPDSIWNSPNTNRAFWREKVLSMLHYDTP